MNQTSSSIANVQVRGMSNQVPRQTSLDSVNQPREINKMQNTYTAQFRSNQAITPQEQVMGNHYQGSQVKNYHTNNMGTELQMSR